MRHWRRCALHIRVTDNSWRPIVQLTQPMRGQQPAFEAQPIGSLRNVADSVKQCPGHQLAGGHIRDTLLQFLHSKPAFPRQCCDLLGGKAPLSSILPDDKLQQLRQAVRDTIRRHGTPAAVRALDSPHTPPPGDKPTDLQPSIIQAWSTWAGDPAAASSSCAPAAAAKSLAW